MSKFAKFAFSAALGTMMLGGIFTSAYAQEDIGKKIIPSLEYEQADVREALRALFNAVGVSYSVSPEVQGQVTVSLKNATFEQALQQITRQVDATYRVEMGIWQIVRREADVTPTNDPNTFQATQTTNKTWMKIRIRSADPQFLALLIGPQSGNQYYNGNMPEITTISNTGGGGYGSGNGNGNGNNRNGNNNNNNNRNGNNNNNNNNNRSGSNYGSNSGNSSGRF